MCCLEKKILNGIQGTFTGPRTVITGKTYGFVIHMFIEALPFLCSNGIGSQWPMTLQTLGLSVLLLSLYKFLLERTFFLASSSSSLVSILSIVFKLDRFLHLLKGTSLGVISSQRSCLAKGPWHHATSQHSCLGASVYIE